MDEAKAATKTPVDVPKGRMYIKVYAPFHVYFDDIGESISAVNDTGPFDILAGHHNFMTLLSTCDIIVRTDRGEEEKIPIQRGIMHVKADRVIVFLDVWTACRLDSFRQSRNSSSLLAQDVVRNSVAHAPYSNTVCSTTRFFLVLHSSTWFRKSAHACKFKVHVVSSFYVWVKVLKRSCGAILMAQQLKSLRKETPEIGQSTP